ncbi:MFS transporter [Variovorax sp.]|uniref:MFS transporter n=1 Tax=Variovorax sp. TaxID=1871043 RepID=UPI002D63B5B4|nr:MFS transporter [Variovorax sp.]HYP85310.1 MFS transporter [Variovorax sp.]
MSSTPAPAGQRRLDRSAIKTLAFSALGGSLEYYDFVIYVFFAGVIGTLFFPSHLSPLEREMQAFGVFAAGYLARPLGGLVFGKFGDRLGRKRMFTLSVLLMAVPTLLIACLPTFDQIGWFAPALLLVMRVLQGVAVGGELTGAWVFVGEHSPPKHYGFGLGTITAGSSGGILLGSLVAYVVHLHFSAAQVHDFAWRLPFVLGGVFGLVAVYLRSFLRETPVFQAMIERRQVSARAMPLRAIISQNRFALAYLGLQTWTLAAALGVVLLLAPSYMQRVYGVPAAQTMAANAVATMALLVGNLLVGWATDRVGSRVVMFVGWVGVALSCHALFAGLPSSFGWLVAHYAIAGLFVGTIAIVPIIGVRAFPAAVRSTGLSFGYNVFYAIFGGLTPVLVSALSGLDHMAPAWYVMVLCAIGAAAAFFKPSVASDEAGLDTTPDTPAPQPIVARTHGTA